MSLDQPSCPKCGSALTKTADGALDTWVCPNGHGLGMTLTEAYGRLQEDEIHALWAAARAATVQSGPCPLCGRPMVTTTIELDADEAPPGQAGGGPATTSATIAVCSECELLWFDTGELAEFPRDLPNPEPTSEELAKIEQVKNAFGQAYFEAAEGDDANSLGERWYRHAAGHAHVVGFANKVL